MLEKICELCLNKFLTTGKKRKYCSKKCYYEMKIKRKDRVKWTEKMRNKLSKKYTGKGNPMYGKSSWCRGKKRPEMTGELHPNYKRGYYINPDGYKIIHKKTKEHREIIEKFIGRKLLESEVIHHINEDKLDNRIENLQILTRSEHAKLHRKTH